MPGGAIYKKKTEIMASLAVILILTILLMPRPIKGVADNGDFARIMNSTGLSYISDAREDRYFGYVNRLYNTGLILPLGGGYLSTQIPLVLLAVNLSKAISGTSFFDIRYLGALYILILVPAAYLAAGSIKKRTRPFGLIIIIVLLAVFCDFGYTSYFNSLYGEPVTFTFLLLMAGAALALSQEEKPAMWMLAIFCTAAFFFTGAKLQNSPAGLLAALLCLRLAWLRKDKAWKKVSVISGILIAVLALACYINVSYEIKVCNKYQSVFYGVLKNSRDPAGDLRELGLDPSLAPLAGTNYFMEEYPLDIRTTEFKKMIYDNVNPGKIALFYLRHPVRFLQKMDVAAENGFQLKQGFGNYEKYPGIIYKQTSDAFSFWSNFKMRVLPHTLPFVCVFYTAVLLALIYEYRRAVNIRMRFLAEFFAFVAVTGIMQFVLPVVADGEADLGKHLFLFNLSFDLLFSGALTYVMLKAAAAVRQLKNRRIAAKLQPE